MIRIGITRVGMTRAGNTGTGRAGTGPASRPPTTRRAECGKVGRSPFEAGPGTTGKRQTFLGGWAVAVQVFSSSS
jgi:hypothetical protein